jgi:hypothetical protein
MSFVEREHHEARRSADSRMIVEIGETFMRTVR